MFFSDLYKRETVPVTANNGKVYEIVVREVPHGEMVAMQDRLIGKIKGSANKDGIMRQLENKEFKPSDFSEYPILLAIESWSFVDADGEPVPINEETLAQLPESIIDLVKEAIERLNPTLDDDFPGES